MGYMGCIILKGSILNLIIESYVEGKIRKSKPTMKNICIIFKELEMRRLRI